MRLLSCRVANANLLLPRPGLAQPWQTHSMATRSPLVSDVEAFFCIMIACRASGPPPAFLVDARRTLQPSSAIIRYGDPSNGTFRAQNRTGLAQACEPILHLLTLVTNSPSLFAQLHLPSQTYAVQHSAQLTAHRHHKHTQHRSHLSSQTQRPNTVRRLPSGQCGLLEFG